jgi:non-canonical (house-cleaning) NTP pyrophosphatase
MTIAVGTTNIVKIQAIEEAIKDYPLLAQAKVTSFSVDSEVSEQPISLEETIRGAKNRAKMLFQHARQQTIASASKAGYSRPLGPKQDL